MMIRSMIRFLILASASLATVAYAASEVDVTSMSLEDSKPTQNKDIYNPKGFWPLIGGGLGYMNNSDNIRTEGMPMNIKAIGSYYFQGPWVAELGGGLYNEILTEKGKGADTIQSVQLETAARYNMQDRWFVGPVWTTLTGNDRYSSNTKNWTSFLGVQLKKEIAWDNEYLVRMGGRFMTDVGVSGEQINAAMFEVEVGLGEGGSAPVAEVAPLEDHSIAPHLANQAMNGPIIFDGPMNFIVDKARMISSADQRANRLARILADNSQLFDSILVEGHADERGTVQYNQRLSEDRADYVASKFKKAGLSAARVNTIGKGKLEPLVASRTETAFFKNRRVAVRVLGVKDQMALESLLRSIR